MSANDQNGCEGMNNEEEKLEGQKNKQTNKHPRNCISFHRLAPHVNNRDTITL